MLYRKLIVVSVMLIVSLSGLVAAMTDNLVQQLNNYGDEDFVRINLILKDQYDFNTLYKEVKQLPNPSRRERTIDLLKSHSRLTQHELRDLMRQLQDEGSVKDVQYLWIINALTMRIQKKAIPVFDSRNDIMYVDYDSYHYMLGGLMPLTDENIYYNTDETSREITYNVDIVNAPDVWSLGYTGDDIIVAVLDTGVNYLHQDIINNMWIHPDYPYHGYNFSDNNNNPFDTQGHGSHCAGTVAGDGSAGSQTGVAPTAKIMALKVLDNSGGSNESNVWLGVQFAVDNSARVLSMSIGWQMFQAPNRYMFRTVMSNTLAAGVVASVAAGNEGGHQVINPIPFNLRTPGDCPPPWLHPDQTLTGGLSAVITSGATNANNQLAAFSSRGPTTWQTVPEFGDYPYFPGMGLIKPDICAPGVDIKSLSHLTNNGYVFMSGTSMATPATSGVIALMLSKNSGLSPEVISQLIEENAYSLAPNKNNDTGSGIIDALAIINAIPDEPPNAPVNPNPPSQQSFVTTNTPLKWQNGGWALHYILYVGTDNPPANMVDGLETENLLYHFPEALEPETSYFWRVDAVNSFGTTQGNVWSFTTGSRTSEDFESGDFTSHDWVLLNGGNGSTDWSVQSNTTPFGLYAAQSGNASANNTSTLEITIDVLEDGILSFYKKTETPPNKFLKFYIDGSLASQWSGVNDWSLEFYNLESGQRTLKWDFFSHNDDGLGTVWIDEISFPFNLYDCLSDVYVSVESHDIEFDETLLMPLLIDFDSHYDVHSWQTVIAFNPEIIHFLSLETENSLMSDQDIYYELEDGNLYISWSSEIALDEFNLSELFYFAFKGRGDGISLIEIIEFKLNNKIVLSTENGQATVTNTPELLPPQNIQYQLEAGSITLFWQEPGTLNYDPDYYNVYRNQVFYEQLENTVFQFTDTDITPATHYEYFLTAVYTDMLIESEPSETVSVVSLTAEETGMLKPENEFIRVYPNPFFSGTKNRTSPHILMEFNVSGPGEAEFAIYNIKGQLVKVIKIEGDRQGKNVIGWDGKNMSGQRVSPGVYIISFTFQNHQEHKKIIILE